MEQLLDDNIDHAALRQDRLLKRRNKLRPLNAVLPLFIALVIGWLFPEEGREPLGHIISVFIGFWIFGGMVGWLTGTILSWLMWQDMNKDLRKKYLVTMSTLVFNGFWVVLCVVNIALYLMGWLR